MTRSAREAGTIPAMNYPRRPACMLLVTLGCSPSVIESSNDDVAEGTTGDTDASSEASGDTTSTSTSETSTETSADSSTDSSTTTSSDDPACTLGTLDCGCEGGSCDVGLACVDDVCVEDVGTDTTDTTDTGVEPHNCGWVLRKNYYFCGGEGIDPSMQNPAECDAFDFPMVSGAPCGPELNYVGCCDAMGDAWYCLEGFIKYEVCGA